MRPPRRLGAPGRGLSAGAGRRGRDTSEPADRPGRSCGRGRRRRAGVSGKGLRGEEARREGGDPPPGGRGPVRTAADPSPSRVFTCPPRWKLGLLPAGFLGASGPSSPAVLSQKCPPQLRARGDPSSPHPFCLLASLRPLPPPFPPPAQGLRQREGLLSGRPHTRLCTGEAQEKPGEPLPAGCQPVPDTSALPRAWVVCALRWRSRGWDRGGQGSPS